MHATDPAAEGIPQAPRQDNLRMLWPQDVLYATIVQVQLLALLSMQARRRAPLGAVASTELYNKDWYGLHCTHCLFRRRWTTCEPWPPLALGAPARGMCLRAPMSYWPGTLMAQTRTSCPSSMRCEEG